MKILLMKVQYFFKYRLFCLSCALCFDSGICFQFPWYYGMAVCKYNFMQPIIKQSSMSQFQVTYIMKMSYLTSFGPDTMTSDLIADDFVLTLVNAHDNKLHYSIQYLNNRSCIEIKEIEKSHKSTCEKSLADTMLATLRFLRVSNNLRLSSIGCHDT